MPDLPKNVKSIFGEALDIASDKDRSKYLDEACGNDKSLRVQVEELMAAVGRAGNFLVGEVPVQGTLDQPLAERPGMQLGPYKLLEQIGEGGMGVVYMAQQTHPVKRRVAVKVVKPGMDSRQVIARFEAERQALAMMDHPSIARVLDAGTTETSRPYFVMELVRGIPITEYCDRERLDTRRRLQLFADVCRAVQHAHTKAIIHRDLKPSNVLVTLHDGVPVVKVIDFGVAKALNQELTERTLFTKFSQLVGTPLYMSPEQAELSGLDIDTRTDIYSLGVMLYELLTSTTPFDKDQLSKAGFDEMRRMIREDEPLRPSDRISTLNAETLSTVSRQRSIDERRMRQHLRGELDWIVMKTLEKDRNRRYESASALASDIQRYLNDEPVQACPPSAMYRLSKYVRRNKAKLAIFGTIATVLFALFIVAVGISSLRRQQQVEMDRQVELALQEATIYQGEAKWPEALAAVGRAGVLVNDRYRTGPLKQRVDRLRRDLEMSSKLDEIRLRSTGTADSRSFGIGEFGRDAANAEYHHAFSEYGINVGAMQSLEAGEFVRAQAIHRELISALDHWARLLTGSASHQETWKRLLQIACIADSDNWRKQLREAIERLDKNALMSFARAEQVKDLSTASVDLLAVALHWLGAKEEAVALLREAQVRNSGDYWINVDLAKLSSTPGDYVCYFTAAVAARPQDATARMELGWHLMTSGHLDDAVAVFREAVRRKPDYSRAHMCLGVGLLRKGMSNEAMKETQKAIRLSPKQTEREEDYLGLMFKRKGLLTATIAQQREAARKNPSTKRYDRLGKSLLAAGLVDEAADAFRKSIELDKTFGPSHRLLGDTLAHLHRTDEAIDCYREAIRLKEPAYGGLAHLFRSLGRFDEAIAVYREAIADNKNDDSYMHYQIGETFQAVGQLKEAIGSFREAVRLESGLAMYHARLASALQADGQLIEAIACYREAVQRNDRFNGILYLQNGNNTLGSNPVEAEIDLANALYSNGQMDEAAAYFSEAMARFEHRLRPDQDADAHVHFSVAWMLATCPDASFRDVSRAVELAKRLASAPAGRDGLIRRTLGVAQYRAGDYPSAIAALREAMAVLQGGNSYEWFFLAMAHWQLDQKGEARKWYDKAAELMEQTQPKNDELLRFRAEAAALLGIDAAAKPESSSKTTQSPTAAAAADPTEPPK